jgi:dTMP kinase
MFVTFEGGEGSGKSTAVKTVSERLSHEGCKIFLTREPGGDTISEEIRKIILDKRNTDMDPRTEALLYAAARRQHVVKELLPALKRGDLILCDRYIDSSLAYQGGARGLGIDNVLNINLFATEGLEPDLTLLFDLDPEIGLKRIAANAGREVNRLDVEKLPFHKKVRAAFHELAARFPKRYVVIDASQSEEEVAEIVYQTIKERMGK